MKEKNWERQPQKRRKKRKSPHWLLPHSKKKKLAQNQAPSILGSRCRSHWPRHRTSYESRNWVFGQRLRALGRWFVMVAAVRWMFRSPWRHRWPWMVAWFSEYLLVKEGQKKKKKNIIRRWIMRIVELGLETLSIQELNFFIFFVSFISQYSFGRIKSCF